MRLAFWRAGKVKDVVQRAVGTQRPRPAAHSLPPQAAVAAARRARPVAAPESGDLDLHALGQALIAQAQPGSSSRRVLAAVLSIAAVNMVTPRYKSEARILIDGRENVFLRPNGERNEERNALDRRGGHQPGAAVAVARSGARDHQEEQARRAPGIRSGAAGLFAAEVAAGAVRYRPRSALADAGRARAGRLLRPLHRLCGRQVARHRHRIPVARSGAGGARRQFDRRRLSGAAAERAAGAGEGRRPVAVG